MAKWTIEEYQEMSENHEGGCIVCGAIRGQCEPDAEDYECEECGAFKVLGADNLLIMGYVV